MQCRRTERFDAVGEDTAEGPQRCGQCWEGVVRLTVQSKPMCLECAKEVAAGLTDTAQLSLSMTIGAVEHQLRLAEAAQAARQAATTHSMARLKVLDAAEQWARVCGTEEEAPRAEKLRAEVASMQRVGEESSARDVELRRVRAGAAS